MSTRVGALLTMDLGLCGSISTRVGAGGISIEIAKGQEVYSCGCRGLALRSQLDTVAGISLRG